MNKNEARSTHFGTFAKLLLDELHAFAFQAFVMHREIEELEIQKEQIIARRAYDLVQHTVLSIGPADLDRLTTDECVQSVPDLAELPVEKAEEQEKARET